MDSFNNYSMIVLQVTFQRADKTGELLLREDMN